MFFNAQRPLSASEWLILFAIERWVGNLIFCGLSQHPKSLDYFSDKLAVAPQIRHGSEIRSAARAFSPVNKNCMLGIQSSVIRVHTFAFHLACNRFAPPSPKQLPIIFFPQNGCTPCLKSKRNVVKGERLSCLCHLLCVSSF